MCKIVYKINIHTQPTTETILQQHDHYYLYLARFPLSSEVLGPRVVNFEKFWSRDVPAGAL